MNRKTKKYLKLLYANFPRHKENSKIYISSATLFTQISKNNLYICSMLYGAHEIKRNAFLFFCIFSSRYVGKENNCEFERNANQKIFFFVFFELYYKDAERYKRLYLYYTKVMVLPGRYGITNFKYDYIRIKRM